MPVSSSKNEYMPVVAGIIGVLEWSLCEFADITFRKLSLLWIHGFLVHIWREVLLGLQAGPLPYVCLFFYTYFHNLFGLSEVAMISRSKSRMRTSRALFMLTIPLCWTLFFGDICIKVTSLCTNMLCWYKLRYSIESARVVITWFLFVTWFSCLLHVKWALLGHN